MYWSGPDAEELWSFSGCRRLALSGQTAYVVDGQDRGGDEPRRAEQRADSDLNGYHQQIKVVPRSFLPTTQ